MKVEVFRAPGELHVAFEQRLQQLLSGLDQVPEFGRDPTAAGDVIEIVVIQRPAEKGRAA